MREGDYNRTAKRPAAPARAAPERAATFPAPAVAGTVEEAAAGEVLLEVALEVV
jgi:hypothetical protein